MTNKKPSKPATMLEKIARSSGQHAKAQQGQQPEVRNSSGGIVKEIPSREALVEILQNPRCHHGRGKVRIDWIEFYKNPRSNLDQDDIEHLKKTIRLGGMLQPIGIFHKNGKVCAAYGHKRWEAHRQLVEEATNIEEKEEFSKISSQFYFIQRDSQLTILQTFENNARTNLKPLDECLNTLAFKNALIDEALLAKNSVPGQPKLIRFDPGDEHLEADNIEQVTDDVEDTEEVTENSRKVGPRFVTNRRVGELLGISGRTAGRQIKVALWSTEIHEYISQHEECFGLNYLRELASNELTDEEVIELLKAHVRLFHNPSPVEALPEPLEHKQTPGTDKQHENSNADPKKKSELRLPAEKQRDLTRHLKEANVDEALIKFAVKQKWLASPEIRETIAMVIEYLNTTAPQAPNPV